MITAALPLAVGGSVLSGKLIELVAGPEYVTAAPVLAILIWAPAVLFIYIPANSLVISQLTKKALAVTGANVVINTLGNLYLLPRYGIKAAAIMTVFSECIQGCFYFYFINKNITSFSFQGLWFKPMLAALIMGVVLWPFKNAGLFLSLPLGAVVYFLVLIITGFLGRKDIAMAKQLFKPSSV
jgi:O-antigen/teichoic acid export membrane protein